MNPTTINGEKSDISSVKTQKKCECDLIDWTADPYVYKKTGDIVDQQTSPDCQSKVNREEWTYEDYYSLCVAECLDTSANLQFPLEISYSHLEEDCVDTLTTEYFSKSAHDRSYSPINHTVIGEQIDYT